MRFSTDPPSPQQAPRTRLGHSPSTPNFSSLHPLNPAPTSLGPSAPTLRQGERVSKVAKIKAFIGRATKQPAPQLPTTYSMQALAPLAERDETGSLTDSQDDLSQVSTAVAPAPSPLDIGSDVGSATDPTTEPEMHEHETNTTTTTHTWPSTLPLDGLVRGAMDLERAKLVALGDDRTYDEHVVRKYRYLTQHDHCPAFGTSGCDGQAIDGDSTDNPLEHAQDPVGLWRCCKCAKGHELYQYDQGPHLVSGLNCDCTHRSCEDCTLTGGIKAYKPVYEPFPVQLDDKDKRVLFGIFCGYCGSSWQAQITGYMQDTVRQKIAAVPKNLAKHGTHPLEKLRSSRSMTNLLGQPTPKAPSLKANKSTLNLRALSNEMEKEYGKQASLVMVQFSGIVCTCGWTLDTSALCFQIVDQQEKKAVEAPAVVGKQATFTATSEDKAKGIETPTIMLRPGGRKIQHANPLRSAPVTDEEMARLYDD